MVSLKSLHGSLTFLPPYYFTFILGVLRTYILYSVTINKPFMPWLKADSIGWKSINMLILLLLWIFFTEQQSIRIWFIEGLFLRFFIWVITFLDFFFLHFIFVGYLKSKLLSLEASLQTPTNFLCKVFPPRTLSLLCNFWHFLHHPLIWVRSTNSWISCLLVS